MAPRTSPCGAAYRSVAPGRSRAAPRGSLDLATVSARIAESVLGLLRVHGSAIRLLQPAGALKAIALGGRIREYVASHDVVLTGVGLIGAAAGEGRSMWTEDFRSDPRDECSAPRRQYNDAVADDSPDALAMRLRTTFDLCALGEAMRRAQIRRDHPDASDDEIEALLVTWLETRPGAEHGDGWGRHISWPPARR